MFVRIGYQLLCQRFSRFLQGASEVPYSEILGTFSLAIGAAVSQCMTIDCVMQLCYVPLNPPSGLTDV